MELAVAALLIAAGVYLGSPYLAARTFKQAALSGDADKLDATVDFPELRESLKSQMSAALMKKMATAPEMKGNPFAGLGMMIMSAIIDRAVDAYITSDGLAALVRGAKPSDGKGEPRTANPDVKYDYEWVNLDRFRVKIFNRRTHEQGPSLVFDRTSVAKWKLVKLELPDSLFDKP